jgi:hypothetical protein
MVFQAIPECCGLSSIYGLLPSGCSGEFRAVLEALVSQGSASDGPQRQGGHRVHPRRLVHPKGIEGWLEMPAADVARIQRRALLARERKVQSGRPAVLRLAMRHQAPVQFFPGAFFLAKPDRLSLDQQPLTGGLSGAFKLPVPFLVVLDPLITKASLPGLRAAPEPTRIVS